MSRRLGGPRAHRKSMIVQTSPILGGGARCQSPLGPPGVSASSDVRAQVTWQPAALITSLQHCSTCLQPSVFSLRPQQEYLGLTQGPHPHSLPHLGRSRVTIMASHGHWSYLPHCATSFLPCTVLLIRAGRVWEFLCQSFQYESPTQRFDYILIYSDLNF